MNKSQAIKILFTYIDDITENVYDASELLMSSNNLLKFYLNEDKRDAEIANDNFEELSYLDDEINSQDLNKLNSQVHLLYPNSEDYETSYSKYNKINDLMELKYA